MRRKAVRRATVQIAIERARYWLAVAEEAAGDTMEAKTRIVENWRWTLLKSASMWAHYIGTTLVALFLMVPAMPKEIQALVPVQWQAIAVAAWFMLGIAARLWKQRA